MLLIRLTPPASVLRQWIAVGQRSESISEWPYGARITPERADIRHRRESVYPTSQANSNTGSRTGARVLWISIGDRQLKRFNGGRRDGDETTREVTSYMFEFEPADDHRNDCPYDKHRHTFADTGELASAKREKGVLGAVGVLPAVRTELMRILEIPAVAVDRPLGGHREAPLGNPKPSDTDVTIGFTLYCERGGVQSERLIYDLVQIREFREVGCGRVSPTGFAVKFLSELLQ